jgi:hypothetical protein
MSRLRSLALLSLPALLLACGGSTGAPEAPSCQGKHIRFHYQLVGSTADRTVVPTTYEGTVAGGYFAGGPDACGLRWWAEEGSLSITRIAGREIEAEIALPFVPNDNPEFAQGATGSFTLKGTIASSCFEALGQ